MNDLTTITTTVAGPAAVRVEGRTCLVAARPSAVVTGPYARARALAPTMVTSLGHVRLDADVTGFAGNPAWSPPI